MKNIITPLLCCCLMFSVGLAEAIDPRSNDLVNQGWVLENQGKYDEALSLYDQALGIDPQNYVAYKHRGTAFTRMKNYEQAELEFGKSIAINPGHESTYYNRGLMYYQQGAYGKAISDYSKAIELNPNYTNAVLNRAAAYVQIGEDAKANADYARYAQLNPADKHSYSASAIRTKANNERYAMLFLLCAFIFLVLVIRLRGIMRSGSIVPPPAPPPMTDSQQDEVRRVFKERKKWHDILSIVILAAYLYFRILRGFHLSEDQLYTSIAGIFSCLAIYAIVNFRTWRCPWCSKYLGRGTALIICPHCGVNLK